MNLDPDFPPEFGEIQIELPVAPVSQQASSAAKRAVFEHIRQITRPLKYVLNSQVQIDIEWLIHERLRWETDASPDVDNIIKPLLDGLCGPEGVLIDDCQVQRVMSSWIDWTEEEQRVIIRIKFHPGYFLSKEGLIFVRVKQALCYPVPKKVQEKALHIWLQRIERALQEREQIMAATGDYYAARSVLPHGFIHVSRLKGFNIVDLEKLKGENRGEAPN